ncbi:MAG TPA: alpha/beta fold hydrolase [Vicinamibacterales bacterium]|jgi:predicted esterase|nr:alpha/beta fold hydrolase [Vicinamibacterales bacterium]
MTSVLRAGRPPASARLTAIMVHGRGASGHDILALAAEIGLDDVAYVAPEAPGHTWYPYSFLSPIEQNEPQLTHALQALDEIVHDLMAEQTPRDRIALIGFSQGACLLLEFAARHAGRYAALVAFSGGLIGPPGTPRDYPGSFDGTPLFIGCSDVDPHIPLDRVRESAEVFRRMGASVDERVYPDMAHTVNRDEIAAAAALLRGKGRPTRSAVPDTGRR